MQNHQLVANLRNWSGLLAFAVVFTAIGHRTSHAQARVALSPVSVVYPGDILDKEMLIEIAGAAGSLGYSTASEGRTLLVGKRARKTLIPGQMISTGDVENPRAIVNGAQVQIVYRDGGLAIAASGIALQNAASGEITRVRNQETGLIVSGVAQADGTVVVGGG